MAICALMTKEERQECIEKGLCFVCRKKDHTSRDCPTRKYKKWKGRAKGGKKKKSAHGRHIRAASNDDDDDSGTEKEVSESKPDYTKNIRAMMKGLSMDERNNVLLSLADEDF
jgi:hypothetical protein